jgi:hypothetical protein
MERWYIEEGSSQSIHFFRVLNLPQDVFSGILSGSTLSPRVQCVAGAGGVRAVLETIQYCKTFTRCKGPESTKLLDPPKTKA